MSKTLQDNGMLDENEKPTKGAKKIYIDKCIEIAKNGGTSESLGFSCVQLEPNPTIASLDLYDEKLYKSFHDNWVNGIYADCLKALNLESNIALPIFDPMALSSKLDISLPQPLGLEGALPLLALPAPNNVFSFLTLAGITDQKKITELQIKILTPNAGVIVPIPKLPELPIPKISLEFPDISYESPDLPGYGLLADQLRIFKGLLEAFKALFDQLVKELPGLVVNLAVAQPPGSGFSSIFEMACGAIQKALPAPPGSDSNSSLIYQAALASTLAKPMGVSTVGSIIGSSKDGITGGLGFISPDPAKIREYEIKPPPKNILSAATLPAVEGIEKTTPEFRTKLVELVDEMKSIEPNIYIEADWLAAMISRESGFNPKSKHDVAAAYGLCGWMQSALNNIKVWCPEAPPFELRKIVEMTDIEQLQILKWHQISIFRNAKRRPYRDSGDIYVANYLPRFWLENKMSDDQVMAKWPSLDYTQNSGLDTNKDWEITIGEVKGKLEYRISLGNKRGRISCNSDDITKS